MRLSILLVFLAWRLVVAAEDTADPLSAGGGEDPQTEGDEASQADTNEQPDYNWIDHTHDWIYDKAHGGTVWFDKQFVPEGEEALKVPPSRFRLGLFSEFEVGAGESFSLQPVVDFSTDIHLPNLERRLRLFISTEDPSALPGETPVDSNNEVRVGAARQFFKNWDTSIGVKARWPPEAFANLQWSRKYSAGDHWSLYPKGKLFWDNEQGIGFLTSLVADYWLDRWLFRNSLSGKWNKKKEEDDYDNSIDPDSYLFGQDGKGYRWAATSLVAYVPALLDEKNYGRRISGGDVADGWGIQGRVRGDAVQTLSYEVTFLRKGPLYKEYLYYVIGPQVSWEKKYDWKPEYKIEIGVEMLIWGDNPLR